MAQPDPFVALLTAIQDAQAAGGGTPNAFVPGAQGIPGVGGQPGQDAGGTPAAVSGGISGGASIPGTATTGPGLLENVLAGGGADPLTQGAPFQGAIGLGGNEPGERGDLGAGVTGGDLETLLSVLGGPTAIAAILGSLVTSDALGLPPSTSLGLSDLVGGSADIGSLGMSNSDRDPGGGPVARNTGNAATTPNVNVGSLGISQEDRDKSGPSSGSGSSPNRGDVSNAGR